MYPSSRKHARITPKSLPLCFAGDFNNLSTFSNNTNGGFFASKVSRIDHHKIPFFPSSPLEVANEDATE